MKRPSFLASAAGDRRRDRRGVALLITLSAVVLLTALVLAFFSHSLLNRKISYSNTNLIKADQLARSSLEVVVGELRQEIADPAYAAPVDGGSSAYPVLYRPLTSADAVPRKVGVTGTASTNLFKVSGPDSVVDPGRNGRRFGSAVSIDEPSRNRHYLSDDRWFGSGGPDLGRGETLPTWVYVTRDGLQTPVLPAAADPAQSGYVIGRFAYTVYDLGGLMDANLAGYPAARAAAAPFKASLACADLPGTLGIAGLPAWRNPATGGDDPTFLEWAAGLPRAADLTGANRAALAAAASGHLAAVAGDNAFFSRRDLLLAAQNGVAGLNAAQASVLTHFSRAVNATSWTPPAVSTANPDFLAARFAHGGTLVHFDDTGISSTQTVQAGDPLQQRRFSLARVGWISARGAQAGISAAAIQNAFGLVWNGGQLRWDYAGPSGIDPRTSIETLAQVAAEAAPREPNFFELLKAAIGEGSLGRANDLKTMRIDQAGAQDNLLDQSKDAQVFQIGMDIIDCAGADNFPTTLAFSFGGRAVPIRGVKDLPYLYGMLVTRLTHITYVDPVNDRLDWCSKIMLPELFNPHAAGAAASGGPSTFRIRILSGKNAGVYLASSGTDPSRPLARIPLNLDLADPAGDRAIVIPAAAADDFRAAMKVVRGGEATSPTTLKALVGDTVIDPGSDDYHGFLYYTYANLPEDYAKVVLPAPAPTIRTSVANFMIVLEYQDAQGWHIYDTLTGNDAFAGTTAGGGIGGTDPAVGGVSGTAKLDFGPTIAALTTGTNLRNTLDVSHAMFKFDPRTGRFGLGRSTNTSPKVSAPVLGGGGGYAWAGFTTSMPFGGGTLSANVGFPGAWLLGGKTGWTSLAYADNVADPDGTVRPADGWLGGNADLFATLGDAARRPVILHRPYRSVAELGYVFRGEPWKSLDFFDETSADGALLDLFSVSDEPPIVAGRLELDSLQAAMPQALLSGAGQAWDGGSPLSAAQAGSIAAAFQGYAYAGGGPTSALPVNAGQLPRFMSSASLGAAYPATQEPVKNRREAVVRALAAGTQTRTWNLLVDVVAQVGRFPAAPAAASLADFVVEGERRCWLSVAIDRYTGKIVDEQLEPVGE